MSVCRKANLASNVISEFGFGKSWESDFTSCFIKYVIGSMTGLTRESAHRNQFINSLIDCLEVYCGLISVPSSTSLFSKLRDRSLKNSTFKTVRCFLFWLL